MYLLIFISSKAASISSNIQKEDGLVSKIAKSNATAVNDLSPPDNKFRLWSFFPGGWAVISIPELRTSSSVNLRLAYPPLKSCLKIATNFVFISSNFLVNTSFISPLSLLIALMISSLDSIKSFLFFVIKSNSFLTDSYSWMLSTEKDPIFLKSLVILLISFWLILISGLDSIVSILIS